jgi:signal transduction histidine kinase
MPKLQVRIVAAIFLVTAVSLVGAALFSGSVTIFRAQIVPAKTSLSATTAIQATLDRELANGASSDRIQDRLYRLSSEYGVRIVVVVPARHFVLASWGRVNAPDTILRPQELSLTIGEPNSERVTFVKLHGGDPLTQGGAAARFFVLPVLPPPELAPIRTSILSSIWLGALVATILAAIVAILLGKRISKPISALTDAAIAMSKGATDRRVDGFGDDEIGRLCAAFNTMADAIARTDQLRRRMVTDVAHELRTPLTRIVSQLEAASDGHVTADDAFACALEEAQRLTKIVNDLRDLSLADAHELWLARDVVSLEECIDAAIARAARQAKVAKIALIKDVAAALPLARGDGARIAQILDNLIENALRHTPAGGHITIGAAAHDRSLECFVQDDGLGIDAELLPVIFERFARGDASRNRHTGGCGLGLAIVKSLVEAQGGGIEAESVPEGSRFTWTLPIASASVT